ncbi:MAG: alanine racemase [Clostridia bacterium]|nr:alanine racemase [Clostridia bacterium]
MSAFRPTVLSVDLGIIESNYDVVVRRCQNRPLQIAVVKADAYGHGAPAVSKALLNRGAHMLAVACVDEAVELREAGITAPVLVLGGSSADALSEAVARGVSAAVYAPEHIRALQARAETLGCVARAHLKIDTGMSRIGIRGADALRTMLDAWSSCPRVQMEGIFTHLAAAQSDPDFTRLQLSLFDEACAAVRARGYRPMRHAAASEGIALGPDAWYDAVRPGIVLYGAGVGDLFPGVRPAQTLSTRPVRVQTLSVGDTVSYGRTWRADGPRTVMTLPIGYGDGYPRALSGKADVLVRGRRAPIVGRVCMDQMMVDVTDVPGACLDDEVVLMGCQDGEAITPDELADLIDTIPYEIMLGFTRRVTRVVVER